MMTRKQYVALALVFIENKPLPGCRDDDCHCASSWQEMVEETAQMLADDNPRFDEERFLTACGVES